MKYKQQQRINKALRLLDKSFKNNNINSNLYNPNDDFFTFIFKHFIIPNFHV